MRLLPVLLLALLLRTICAVCRSLWLDEFHSLHHASAPHLFGEGGLLAGLHADNHPPLAFLALRLSRALFGDSELALRLPSILFGLGAIVFAARLARRFEGTWAPRFAPLLVAVSSLQVVVSAEARMYALAGLAVAGLLEALAGALDDEQRERQWRNAAAIALWTAVGLHAHYFFLHYLAVVGAAVGFLWIVDRGARKAAGSVLAGLIAAGVAALPWYATGFREQFFGHDLEPGGRLNPWHSLPEAFVHLEFHNVSLAGPGARLVFLAAAALFVPLVAGAVWRALSRARRQGSLAPYALLIAAGVGVPVWSAAIAWLAPRAGFNWVYLAPSTVPFAVLASTWPRSSRFAPLALGAVSLAALACSGANALRAGQREDYRAAVQWILDDRRAGDAVIAVSPGPALFPPALGWSWYAPRLTDEAPTPVALTPHHRLPNADALEGRERAYLLQRGLDGQFPLFDELRARYAVERELLFGDGLWVHRYTSPRSADEVERRR